MKKLPLVAALAAASLCSMAGAQSVQVYGRLYPFVLQESGSGPTALGTTVSTLSVPATGTKGVVTVTGESAGNSNLGFRGKENLGGGLQAEFQIEGTVVVDTGNAAGFQWNRNTFLGLNGGFGSIKLGLMDTVFKEYGDTLGILGISSGTPMSSSNVLRKPSFGTNRASRFHERVANSVRYDSPEFGGFAGALQWATTEAPSANGNTAYTYSLGIKYDAGPFYFALAQENHDNFFGGSLNVPTAQRNNGAADRVTTRDMATQATIEWRVTKEHKIEFDYIRKSYNEKATAVGRFRKYENNAYLIAIDSRWNSQWRTAAHYVRSDAGSCERVAAACTTDGLEGSKFTAGVSYYLSRRTYLFGVYDQITNGKSARFSNTEFNTPNPGEDIKHFIVGMSHGF